MRIDIDRIREMAVCKDHAAHLLNNAELTTLVAAYEALQELVACDDIVKQHTTGKVRGGRWKAAWGAAHEALSHE